MPYTMSRSFKIKKESASRRTPSNRTRKKKAGKKITRPGLQPLAKGSRLMVSRPLWFYFMPPKALKAITAKAIKAGDKDILEKNIPWMTPGTAYRAVFAAAKGKSNVDKAMLQAMDFAYSARSRASQAAWELITVKKYREMYSESYVNAEWLKTIEDRIRDAKLELGYALDQYERMYPKISPLLKKP